MLSNHILQKTIYTAKKVTGEDLSVYSPDGKALVSNLEEDEKLGMLVREFCQSAAESQVAFSHAFLKIFDEKRVEYVIVTDETDMAQSIGKMVAFQIQELSEAYREKFDKENFIKNLLLDNLLLVDIYNRAKKLSIETKRRRVVMLIRFPKDAAYDDVGKVKDIVLLGPKDFVATINENSVIVVKDLEDDQDELYVEKRAETILAGFPEHIKSQVRISYGKIVDEIRYVSSSYKEAIMAMDVGEIFYKPRQIVSYSLLGIGRLVYQLPLPLCKMFIKEIFGEKSPDEFDSEMLTTIDKFFENSLNVSETSRQLYIHRNTLVYRLDKLEKNTGLDLRTFEDAITFKIAMMVVEYMKYMEG